MTHTENNTEIRKNVTHVALITFKYKKIFN